MQLFDEIHYEPRWVDNITLQFDEYFDEAQYYDRVIQLYDDIEQDEI